ncbi:hypothetical protein I6I07_19670 [Achromobacter deleyi]|uniref:Uncharacterized protein n=1 Tax=Achromobacter deleyi TaxID=1353891 RepID=A0A7T4AZD3_9BURK|nr:hypothetical protein [Achromobacter deleyi]QQB32863.1 hypothetical protein I6I07_19670 [Achromobacter deleyi]
MSRTVVNPDTVFNTVQYGFSQAVIVTGQRRMLLSGQVGVDAQERTVGPGLRDRFPVDPPPSSWIIVSGLSLPEWLVEIEAEAMLD